MIDKADLQGDEQSVEAMNRFIKAYWKPVFCFVRARGYPTDQAEDLTQEFLLQLIERDWLGRADRQRGRLRSFILRILVRFLSDQGPRRAPRQKRFEQQFVAISALATEEDRTFEPQSGKTPEDIFAQRWAVSILKAVLELLRLSFESEGNQPAYEIFATSCLNSGPRPTQEALGQRLGLTRDQVRYAQRQAETRFLQLLRSEIDCQVDSPDEIENELREILSLADQI
jgi:RNA polymerase sigma-70 factor (ECF subfamily)